MLVLVALTLAACTADDTSATPDEPGAESSVEAPPESDREVTDQTTAPPTSTQAESGTDLPSSDSGDGGTAGGSKEPSAVAPKSGYYVYRGVETLNSSVPESQNPDGSTSGGDFDLGGDETNYAVAVEESRALGRRSVAEQRIGVTINGDDSDYAVDSITLRASLFGDEWCEWDTPVVVPLVAGQSRSAQAACSYEAESSTSNGTSSSNGTSTVRVSRTDTFDAEQGPTVVVDGTSLSTIRIKQVSRFEEARGNGDPLVSTIEATIDFAPSIGLVAALQETQDSTTNVGSGQATSHRQSSFELVLVEPLDESPFGPSFEQ